MHTHNAIGNNQDYIIENMDENRKTFKTLLEVQKVSLITKMKMDIKIIFISRAPTYSGGVPNLYAYGSSFT